MRRPLAALAAFAACLISAPALAEPQTSQDPIGDLLLSALTGWAPGTPQFRLKASLYHVGARGVGVFDSLGCRVVAMRTAAIDTRLIPRRTILFIEETVGLKMPDGRVHDGYWYASDTGGAIKGERIDLFTGSGSSSMKPLMPLNLSKLTVSTVGRFEGCPPG